jgi:hypothetical protein
MDLSDISAGARRRAEQALPPAEVITRLTRAEIVNAVLEAITADHPALGAAAVALQRQYGASEQFCSAIQTVGAHYTDIARVVIDAVETYEAEQAESATDTESAPQSEPEFEVGDVVEWYHGSALKVGKIISNSALSGITRADYYHIDRGDGLTTYVRKGAVRAARPVAPWVPKVGDAVEWYWDGITHYGLVANSPGGASHGSCWVDTNDGGSLYVDSTSLRPDSRKFTNNPLADVLYDEVRLALVAVRAQCLLLADREGRSIRRTDVVGLEAHARSCNAALRALARFAGRPVTCQAPDCKRVVEPKDDTCGIHRGTNP